MKKEGNFQVRKLNMHGNFWVSFCWRKYLLTNTEDQDMQKQRTEVRRFFEIQRGSGYYFPFWWVFQVRQQRDKP